MADDKIKNYSLGTAGVVLDPHHLLPGVSPEGLSVAQNAIHDPTAGFGGAIRKRPGFARFNNEYAGGIILGGLMMPVADTGGAPAAGGGAEIGTGDSDGNSVGTGDMTGSPGGTFDGEAVATPAAGAGAFTATELFGGVRLVAVGRNNTAGANNGGAGWYLTSKNFADTANLTTIPQAPCEVYSYPTFQAPNVNGLQGQPSCIGQDGRLYYAAEHGSQATGGTVNGTLPIWVTNGGTSSLLATIPKNTYSNAIATGSTVRAGVMGMHAATDGFLYLAIKDKFAGQDSAGSCGRIFRLRPTTGELVEWNTGAAGTPVVYTSIPYCLNYYEGYLFVGQANHVDAGDAIIVASNGTEGVIDFDLAATSTNNWTCMCQFNGRLFAGGGTNKSAGTGLASLVSRGPTGGIGGGTAWSAFSFDVSRTGNTVNGNSYVSMVVYNDTTAFLSWHAPSSQSIIYKMVANVPGDTSSVDFTLTSSFASGAGATGPLNLYIDDGVIYAISSADGGSTIAWVSTDGGANWVDRSSKFAATGGAYHIPIFFAMDQS